MNQVEIEKICRDRLDRWIQNLVKEHATPVVLVGVGHDDQSGKVVICTTEEMSQEDIGLFLVGAIKELSKSKC
jgi:hypothetical protein